MEAAGFIYVGERRICSRDSPTLLAIRELFNEQITNKAQEPKLCAFIANDPTMIQSFIEGRDIYATIASASFNVPYENCLEFHPETHEYQPDGKARRTEAKSVLLGETNAPLSDVAI